MFMFILSLKIGSLIIFIRSCIIESAFWSSARCWCLTCTCSFSGNQLNCWKVQCESLKLIMKMCPAHPTFVLVSNLVSTFTTKSENVICAPLSTYYSKSFFCSSLYFADPSYHFGIIVDFKSFKASLLLSYGIINRITRDIDLRKVAWKCD